MEKLAADGMTMILVTHEMEFARKVATTTIFMHQGLIHEEGPSQEIFSSPRTREFRQFLGAA
ncbi:Octopine permease ATP-binding protein P [compost metagenome]